MEQPKFQVGQQVEAFWSNLIGYLPANVTKIEAHYTYTVQYPTRSNATDELTENQIRPPRPTEEEAWEKATMLIGQRAYIKGKPITVYPFNENFNRETRHQVYQLLGSAGIKITDEVKADVRRLIEVSDTL